MSFPFSLNRRLVFAVCGLLVLSVALAPAGPVEVMIKFVTVGDPRNPDRDLLDVDRENDGMGYVGQEFQMAEAEVTNEMYARFLNAVAKADRLYGLYSTLMGTSSDGGIVRTGSQGSYAYQVKSGYGNRPVNFVSNFDAMRFSNWLHNGMPGDPSAEDPTRRTPLSGDQTAFSTEDGAYSLLGANNGEIIRRNAGARFYLPDRDEWFKSAYFDPSPGGGRPSDSYWIFADQSDSGPGGNFGPTDSDGQPFKYGDENVNLEPIKTSSGPSHYGTYDQDGNAAEWLDATIASGERFVGRGGGQISTDPVTGYTVITLDDFETELPLTEVNYLGFRVAKRVVPPATGLSIAPPVMVEVGDPGNPGDDTGPVDDTNGIQYRRGRVDYTFQMGAYEVTNGDYVKFLNAVAQDDTFYRLYDSRMQTDARGGITRTGSNGSYKYQTRAGFAKKPVNFVSLWSAMRYCNWLHNGAQPNGDTEAGAYRLLGNIPPNTSNLIRNPSALYFLPTEDEWCKAAFYDPSVTAEATANYWRYATRSDSAQISEINYAGLAAVDVDAYLKQSHFGTFQQSGNIAEWTETTDSASGGDQSSGDGAGLAAGGDRRVLGGSWESAEEGISAAGIEDFPPETKSANIGFRIAALAEAQFVSPFGDNDSDGLPNWWESLSGSDPLSSNGTDPDGDGLTNPRELAVGADPFGHDTDGDDLKDGLEMDFHRTSPTSADTDNDGLTDGAELAAGTSPLVFDTTGASPELVPVDLPGNAGDSARGGKGSVGYHYRIGRFEVTNDEYAAFLNSVARLTDSHGLYDVRMAAVQTGASAARNIYAGGGIVRNVSSGLMTYAVKRGFERKPVNFVSHDSALRYCNWLHNRAADGASTETGAYTMTMAGRKKRNEGARFWLPNQDEWHKAAYYDPSAAADRTSNYWQFAIRADWASPSQVAVGGLSGLLDVNKPGVTSFFGTFGQSGNAAEWIEDTLDGKVLVLGGGVASDWSNAAVAMSVYIDPTEVAMDRGFRIAARAGTPSALARSFQTIKFSKLPAKRVLGTKPLKIRLRATTTSKLKPEFVIDDPGGIAIYVDGEFPYLLVTKPGTLKITARQPGLGRWAAAEEVQQTIEIVPRVK